MNESILFLGTSHGDPTRTRFCSSTLYTFGETKILIDAGEPVSALLIRAGVRPSSLDVVFLTHMHVDHAGGLGELVCQLLKYPDKRTEMFFADSRAVEPFLAWNAAMFNCEIDEKYLSISSVSEDFVWRRNGVTVRPLPTEHMRGRAPAWAYMIETPRSRILHTGDLCGDFHDFPLREDDEPVDLCVCEATHICNNQEIFIDRLRKSPIGKLVFNHIGPFWTDGQEEALRKLAAPLPYPVLIASDGMSVNIGG